MDRLRGWARALKRQAILLWLAARDARVPWAARLLAAGIAAYAFSPIDLIPDVIPVLGLLDELVLLPGLVWLVLRIIPPGLKAELSAKASAIAERPVSRAGAMAVVALWVALGAAALWWWLG
ncbi:DUF1232 domain-containing protein [Roseomonas stagni]|uniref:DUF1232 domain-containing protein n=1 Tax=Falsiroseomonas algicola TaxID=2716930 RepID=A0A6M1LFI7_9PROT|nr:DUF1232 domain-containing protein [Falsiroseomonas algicola]NGM19076.1 DUF1232 domain-containing protein [Falsiroseomonas algicola]